MKTVRNLAIVALIIIAIFDFSTPYIAASQLDGTVNKAVFEALLEYERGKDIESAKARGAEMCAEGGASLVADDPATPHDDSFRIEPDGTVFLKCQKEAMAILAKRVGSLAPRYTIEAERSSKRK